MDLAKVVQGYGVAVQETDLCWGCRQHDAGAAVGEASPQFPRNGPPERDSGCIVSAGREMAMDLYHMLGTGKVQVIPLAGLLGTKEQGIRLVSGLAGKMGQGTRLASVFVGTTAQERVLENKCRSW